MSSHLQGHGVRVATQGARIPGRADQVVNSDGAYVFAVSPEQHLRRFLILGSEGGTFYADEKTATVRGLDGVRAAIDALGTGAVDVIVDVSDGGKAPKNDAAIAALAIAASHPNEAVRAAAFRALPKVCRISTDLFHFCTFIEEHRGWGRALRTAVGDWYIDRSAESLAFQGVKYRQRDGWTHRDVLRLAHPVPADPNTKVVMDWMCGRMPDGVRERLDAGKGASPDGAEFLDIDDPMRIVEGYEKAQRAATPAATAKLVQEYGLPREALKSEHLHAAPVWAAMLDAGMGMEALIRNLPTMTRNDVLKNPGAKAAILDALGDTERLRKARTHPIKVLNALKVYGGGRSLRGDSVWVPDGDVIDALDDAFYKSFDFVEATGQRWMLAVDISASMTWHPCAGMPALDPRTAASALALVTAKAEPHRVITAFSSGISQVALSPRQRLDDVMRTVAGMPAGGTDCSLPMEWAQSTGLPVDVFVVLTDHETNAYGRPQPSVALRRYREAMGIDAKLIVVAMEGNPFSIADPEDPGMLDVVGFSPDTPALMSTFARGLS